MNINYRIIWNATIGKWVVASELAKGRKKVSRNVLAGALAVVLAASAPFGAAFAADTATTAGTCTTSSGQSGTLDVNGICSANTSSNTPDVPVASGGKASDMSIMALTGPGIAVTEGTTAEGTAVGDPIAGANANVAAGAGAANVAGTGNVVVGASAQTNGSGAVAIGVGAKQLGSGIGQIAIGEYTSTQGAPTFIRADSQYANGGGNVAIGSNAWVNVTTNAGAHDSSIALGAMSSTSRHGVLSVGSDSSTNTFTRQVVNVSAGTQGTDAVNVNQLSPVVTALGGGASIDPTTGAVTGPTYTLANGGTQTTVAGAFGALDSALTTTNGNVTNNATAITNIQNQLDDGTVGLVQQASAGANLTVGANTDGTTVDFTGTAGMRTLTGVANGVGANDAVNVSQLTPVVAALGGGATIDPTTGAVTGPTYTVGDGHGGTTTVNTVAGAVTNLDTRVTTNEGSITTLQQQLSDGSVGLVQQASSGANLTVGANTNGTAVDFTGTSGSRILTGVANGVNDSDAVTIAQLKATGLIDYTGKELGALVYDDLTLGTATLGGVGGTIIDNLKNGLIASGSMQAVNGGQLFDMQQNFDNKFSQLNSQYNSLDGRIGTIEQGIADGSIGGPSIDPSLPGTGPGSTQVGDGAVASGDNSTAIGKDALASGSNSTATGAGSQATGNNSTANGAGAVASGNGSTAVGEGASATGTNSTALGSNSSATGNNSVALGAGSVADRDNTVSVGSPGAERQITNVAAGTQRTDAANWGQVQDAVNGVQDWANQKFQQVDKRIDRMGAMSAAYGQMAFSANGLDTKNRLGVGIGAQGGQSALAVGYSRQIRPNMNLSFGGSASAGDVSVGAGLAVGW